MAPIRFLMPFALALLIAGPALAQDRVKQPLNIDPPDVSTDASIKIDYDIVYVRLPRKGFTPEGKFVSPVWAQAGVPLQMHAGAELMLLHPDGKEEVLVPAGKGSVTDPFVSFDGQWVYYSHFHDLTKWNHGMTPSPADIYKIHVPTRKIVRLTDGGASPNTGAAAWSKDYTSPEKGKTHMAFPVCNMGPCPLPNGKIIFTSNRNGFMSPRSTNNGHNNTLQLFVMDDDDAGLGKNVEMIGHLNIGSALHPVVLRDGRVMFSTLENQGRRDDLSWGLWSIHPDGTNWNPVISSFLTTAFHFQTQLSGGDVVAGAYYGGVGTNGFGTYVKLPVERPSGAVSFGPGYKQDALNGPSNTPDKSRPVMSRLTKIPFSPLGIEQLTLWVNDGDASAEQQMKGGPWIGKVTHPSGAPNNHLLTVWNARPKGDHDVDAGIYLIKNGAAIQEPGQMLKVHHDAKYDAQWPRALVPYKAIYGVAAPKTLTPVANDGKLSPHLPEGTPYGLVGSSSLYKRESFPDGRVLPGSVTATWGRDKEKIPFDMGWQNWRSQGADAGLYSNDEIHAIRILAMDPTTDRRHSPPGDPKPGRLFRSHAMERLRILGEMPVRKFTDNKQPLDPDGNPDTSFLAKIPADIAWTFQTLDKNGMVLNMAQTWHQVRPGEVRTDCGGCHAHSQKPTLFEKTAAARADYAVFDLTSKTPLLTSKANDQSGKKWDVNDETGLRFEKNVKNVEYYRDIKPILDRSCTACHTQKWDRPAGNLVLDDDRPEVHSESHLPQNKFPNHYFRLTSDQTGKYGHKPLRHGQYGSRYIWPMQSRRSLLAWHIMGQRTDGFTNDDFPIETIPGDPKSVRFKGEPLADTEQNKNKATVGFSGKIMPPPEAVAGTYVSPTGETIKVAPLTADDKMTIVRWIDLGCPIDLDYDPARPAERGYGWMLDDNRPTLTMASPKAGVNGPVSRILVGMHDYDTGLDMDTFQVVADFPIDGIAAGQDLSSRFKAKSQGVWEMSLSQPVMKLATGKLTVSVRDRQGNVNRIERTVSVP